MTLVWPDFLGGEGRRSVPVAIPRPVFVAVPARLRQAGIRDPNPGPGTLTAWLYRIGTNDEPTHAEVRFADGRPQFFAAGWIAPAGRIVALRPAAPQPERRPAC